MVSFVPVASWWLLNDVFSVGSILRLWAGINWDNQTSISSSTLHPEMPTPIKKNDIIHAESEYYNNKIWELE